MRIEPQHKRGEKKPVYTEEKIIRIYGEDTNQNSKSEQMDKIRMANH